MKTSAAIAKTIWASNIFERLHKHTHCQVSRANRSTVVFRHSPTQDLQHFVLNTKDSKSCLVGRSPNWKSRPNLRTKLTNAMSRNHRSARTTRPSKKIAPGNLNIGPKKIWLQKTKGMGQGHFLKKIPWSIALEYPSHSFPWIIAPEYPNHPFRDCTVHTQCTAKDILHVQIKSRSTITQMQKATMQSWHQELCLVDQVPVEQVW